MNWFKLEVIAKTRQTESAFLVTIQLPKNLRRKFQFLPGQYLTVSIEDKKKKKQSRCYSICSSEQEQHISFCVKHVKGGLLSTYLCEEIKIGDTLSIHPPLGNFILSANQQQRDALFIAGGSGITPVKAMILSLLEQDYNRKITLIYGNRDVENIIFYNFFNQLIQEGKLNVIYSIETAPSEWKGAIGQLSVDNLKGIINKHNIRLEHHEIYICAPEVVINNAYQMLTHFDVSEHSIHTEHFVSNNSPVDSNLILDYAVETTIILNKKTHIVNVSPKQTILDASLDAGLAIDYACKSGICSSCICKVDSGEVHMASDAGLSAKQKQNNFILSCQGYPLNNTTVINFDKNKKQLFSNKRMSLVMGLIFGLIMIGFFTSPSNEIYLSKGDCNIGHENLECNDCHKEAPGTTRQQLQAKVKYWLSTNESNPTIGLNPVDNKWYMDTLKILIFFSRKYLHALFLIITKPKEKIIAKTVDTFCLF